MFRATPVIQLRHTFPQTLGRIPTQNGFQDWMQTTRSRYIFMFPFAESFAGIVAAI